jgi:hypothetical protein
MDGLHECIRKENNEIREGITKHLENEPPSEVDTPYWLFAKGKVRV